MRLCWILLVLWHVLVPYGNAMDLVYELPLLDYASGRNFGTLHLPSSALGDALTQMVVGMIEPLVLESQGELLGIADFLQHTHRREHRRMYGCLLEVAVQWLALVHF